MCAEYPLACSSLEVRLSTKQCVAQLSKWASASLPASSTFAFKVLEALMRLTNAFAVTLASAAMLLCVASVALFNSLCFTELNLSQGLHRGAAASAADCQARCLPLMFWGESVFARFWPAALPLCQALSLSSQANSPAGGETSGYWVRKSFHERCVRLG